MLFYVIGKLPFDGDDHNEIIRKTIQVLLCVALPLLDSYCCVG